MTVDQQLRSGSQITSPVDDSTYNLLQSLTSKLEAIQAYATYEQDAGGDEGQIFQELARDDAQHAERLLKALKERLDRI